MDPVDRTRRTYETIAERYHERTKDARSHRAALDRFVDALPADPLVLDAGCGPGRDLRLLRERGCRVVGLDIAAAQLRVARDYEPAAVLVRGDLRALPVASESVDGVYALASLLHVPRDELDRALAGLYEALRPGGAFFCSLKRREDDPRGDPDERRDDGSFYTHAYDTETGRYFVGHDPDEAAERLRAAGFRVEACERVPDTVWVNAFARRPG